jgi:hypothetical protein
MVKKQMNGILVRSLGCLVGDSSSILWAPTKILNNPVHKWLMGSFHVATSHWYIISMCQHTVSPPVPYIFLSHLLSQTYDVPHGTLGCCHISTIRCAVMPCVTP